MHYGKGFLDIREHLKLCCSYKSIRLNVVTYKMFLRVALPEVVN